MTSTWCCRTFWCCTAAKGRRPPHTPKVSPAPPPWHLGRHDDDLAKYPILPGLAGDVVKPFDYHILHFIFWSFYSEKEHFDIHTLCFLQYCCWTNAGCWCYKVGGAGRRRWRTRQKSTVVQRSDRQAEMRNLNFWNPEFFKWLLYCPQEMRGIWKV